MYVLDTSVISELRVGKREPSRQVRAWAEQQMFDALYLSVVTLLELRVGMVRKARTDPAQGRMLADWIDAIEQQFDGRVLSFGTRTARLCAPMHAPDPKEWGDSLIAATALEHGFTVVTRNVNDFEDFGVPLINPFAGTAGADASK